MKVIGIPGGCWSAFQGRCDQASERSARLQGQRGPTGIVRARKSSYPHTSGRPYKWLTGHIFASVSGLPTTLHSGTQVRRNKPFT